MSGMDVPPNRCPAKVKQRDDRYGGIIDRCDLQVDHEGPHKAFRDACEPRAWLSWVGSYAAVDKAKQA